MSAIGVKIFTDNPPPEIIPHLEPEVPAKTYVLYELRRIIGWVQILTYASGEYELAYLQIIPEKRGKGYARDLVRFALYEHVANPIYALTIIPQFFEKLGFQHTGVPAFVDYSDPVCQACQPDKCTAMLFTKPADLVRYGSEKKLLHKYENDIIFQRNFMGSEFSSTNEKTWIYAENIYLLDIDNYIFLVAYYFQEEPFGVICPYPGIPDTVLDKFLARLRELGIHTIAYVNASVCHVLHKYSGFSKLKINEDRDNFDYLYKVSDFATFAGSRFADKRNRLKKFLRNNSSSEIIPYKPELKETFLNFAKQKFTEMNVDIISEEVLRLGLEQNLYQGFMVRIGKVEIGLLLYSELNLRTVIVHFELMNESYDGVAQFMNNYLGQSLTGKYLFINREQDLGIAGLRRSKLSYNPYRMIKKYSVEF